MFENFHINEKNYKNQLNLHMNLVEIFPDIKIKLTTDKVITKVHKKEIGTSLIINFSSTTQIK